VSSTKGVSDMTDELFSAEGISRREMLKRSAVVGGASAMVWAAPSLTTFSSRAFGSTDGTPVGKAISYIALAYECDNGETRYIKFENFGGSKQDPVYECETGNFDTPGCPSLGNENATVHDADCDLFTVTYDYVDEKGEPTQITICFVEGTDCIIDGQVFGKCGAPQQEQSGGECIELNVQGVNCVTVGPCAA
jgi:hypothetical protein